MSLLTPLGLLGLIGLIVLIIIYIIKPLFQSKIISSTYVWHRSLKYRRKKIPISQLRNILIFICQVLIITAISFILAQPFLKGDEVEETDNTVMIIDASASMLSETGGSSRFDRAISDVSLRVDEALGEEQKRLSVIIASDEAYFLAQSATPESKESIKSALEALRYDTENPAYTYGTPDIAGAMKLAEQITAYTPNAKVLLFTDTEYIDTGKVEVIDKSDPADYNAAILAVRSKMVENFYQFEIDVASYGLDSDIDVYCTFYGVNDQPKPDEYKLTARCVGDEITTLTFSREEGATQKVEIYEYNYVHVSLSENDSLDTDNSFFLYGGKRPVLNVQYMSTKPNNFFATALMVLRDRLGGYWDLNIDEVRIGDQPKTEGYDLYIFEHMVPSTMPKDGIVFLSNPPSLPSNIGAQLGNVRQYNKDVQVPLTLGESHPIMKNIDPENITVNRYQGFKNLDGYTSLLECGGDSLLAVKNTSEAKIVLMGFSLNYSNFAVRPEFSLFMLNLVNYFAPKTFDGFVFEIGDEIELSARAESLNFSGGGKDTVHSTLPATESLLKPGVYTVTQQLLSGETVVESFFVKLPAEESDINHTEDALQNPFFYQESEGNDLDLLIYLAAALVALLFIEWWLKSREQA